MLCINGLSCYLFGKNVLEERCLYTGKATFQICFMNESPCDTDTEAASPRQHDLYDNAPPGSKHTATVDDDVSWQSFKYIQSITMAPSLPFLLRILIYIYLSILIFRQANLK